MNWKCLCMKECRSHLLIRYKHRAGAGRRRRGNVTKPFPPAEETGGVTSSLPPPPSLSSSCLKPAGAWATQMQTWRQWENWCWCWDYWWALTARWEHETPRRKGSWEEEEEEEECSPFTPGRPRPAHWERRGAIRPDPGESTNHCLLTLQKKNNFIEKMFFFVSVKLFVAVKFFFFIILDPIIYLAFLLFVFIVLEHLFISTPSWFNLYFATPLFVSCTTLCSFCIPCCFCNISFCLFWVCVVILHPVLG